MKSGTYLGVCPKCGQLLTNGNNLPTSKSTHHILPKRHYNGHGTTIILCRRCHNRYHNFEDNLLKGKKAEPYEFYQLFEAWIKNLPLAKNPLSA
jgi:5-methylcytosine-specific restriction endonuclease McrA